MQNILILLYFGLSLSTCRGHSFLLLGFKPLLCLLLMIALHTLHQVLDQRLLHRLTKLKSFAEVSCNFTDIVTDMNSDSTCLSWCDIDIYIEQKLSLLRLLKVGRADLGELNSVKLFPSSPSL